jgi:dUTP pyrophosphatase
MSLLVKKLEPSAILPTVTHPGEDLGFDLYALENTVLIPNKVCKVKTGISARYIKEMIGFEIIEGEPICVRKSNKYWFWNWAFTASQSTLKTIEKIIPSDRNYGLLFRDRSSMASKGITVSGGVVDAGYLGELMVLLTNHNETEFKIQKGDKIVQMIPTEVNTGTEIKEVDELPASNRNANGFGSSGR